MGTSLTVLRLARLPVGTRVTAKVAVRLDDGTTARPTAASCRMTLAGQPIKPVAPSSLKLPKAAKGKRVVVTARGSYRGTAFLQQAGRDPRVRWTGRGSAGPSLARAVPIPDLLDRLLRAPRPSGREENGRRDSPRGGVAARGRGLDGRARLDDGGARRRRAASRSSRTSTRSAWRSAMWAATGCWRCTSSRTSTLAPPSRSVSVVTAAGTLTGVVGVRTTEKDKPAFDDLYVDIGAHDGEEAISGRPGDAIVLLAAPVELRGGRIASGALDNRASVWVALEALRRLAEEPAACRVAVVGTVHEEVMGTTSAAVPLRAWLPTSPSRST